MTSSPWYLDPASEEQAALWAARLDGSSLTATDRAALDAWLTEDSAHRALLSRYCQFSADLEQQLPALVEAGALELPSGSAPRRSVRWLKWGAGAVLATAAAAALMFWLGRPQTQTENLATPTAMRQTLTLADGSRAELNAQTSLRIEIDGKARRLRLASGEVFFAVRKDASRPFTVETPAGSVRVTGTQFDVRAESPATLEVTVVDGSVQARLGDAAGRPGAPVSLAAGEQLSAGPSGVEVHALTPAALDAALAWRQGQVVFNGVPLREALARFARYHGRGIMATADTAELRVGGRFSLDDLDGFFAALEEALPVRVTRNLNGTVQVSLRIER
jgi:transmembrane sensor